jgi:hypothetical protein
MATLSESDFDHIIYLAGCTLARKAGKNNWVEEEAVNGLPEYICRIARAILRSGKHTISQAIAIAVSRAKAWASGRGGVNADTRAKAAKAVAEWERKKAAAKLNNKVKASNVGEVTLFFANSYNIDEVRRQYKTDNPSNGSSYTWVREVWSDFLIVSKEDSHGAITKTVKVPYTVDKSGKATFGEEKEVKQAYVELSSPDLQTALTDEQLEKATLIPCTKKDRGTLSEMVRLASEEKTRSEEMLQFSSDKPNLAALLQMAARR